MLERRMTRSGAVNQETRMVGLEEHIRVLQESAKKDKEELRDEIKKSAIKARNTIMEEL